jgi:hypothetical protein
VTTLTQVLEVNWIILYFIYGQVFFVTGLVTGLQWRRRSDLALARPLPWLAAFGIGLGLYVWGHIFIPLQVVYLSDTVVGVMVLAHLMLLAGSFFFLFQFCGVGAALVTPAALAAGCAKRPPCSLGSVRLSAGHAGPGSN